jgi:23S rRNA pseudouridine955/2504/2580 synthase
MAKPITLASLIIVEDEDYMLLNKPPFIPSLDERHMDAQKVSIIGLLRKEMPDAQLCHRLDRETSGAILIAKHPEAYRHAAIQFEKRQVEKRYHAVVDGVHSLDDKEVDMAIAAGKNGLMRIDMSGGKQAVTFFTSKQFFKHHTLVDCQPITGRTHQIRLHLSAIKAPISGDEVYGGKPVFLSHLKRKYAFSMKDEEQPIMDRFALHAFSLAFKKEDGTVFFGHAEYPKDMAVLHKLLEKYDS